MEFWPRNDDLFAAEFDCAFLRACGIGWAEAWFRLNALQRLEYMRITEREMMNYKLPQPFFIRER